MWERRRKFVIAAAGLVMSFVLALLGNLDGTSWAASVAAIVGLYSGAEAWEGRAYRESISVQHEREAYTPKAYDG